jgi:hypothetical protein
VLYEGDWTWTNQDCCGDGPALWHSVEDGSDISEISLVTISAGTGGVTDAARPRKLALDLKKLANAVAQHEQSKP